MILIGKDGDLARVRRKRRSWNRDEKRRIVDESLEEGASIAEVARRHNVNANQLFTWRRQFGVDPAELKELTPILPVTIAPDTRWKSPIQDRVARWRLCSPRATGSWSGLT